jgi:hypothetical protein
MKKKRSDPWALRGAAQRGVYCLRRGCDRRKTTMLVRGGKRVAQVAQFLRRASC